MELEALIEPRRNGIYLSRMKSAHAGFVAAIRERLDARKLSARAAASQAGLPERSVQGVLEGHVPSIDRAAEICHALGLEFYVGPARGRGRGGGELAAPRGGQPENQRGLSDVEKSVHGLVSAVLAAGGNPFPPNLRDETLTALVATHEAPPGTRPVDVVEFAAAAGGGTEIDSERVRGLAWFSRSWLDRLGLDATKCAIIRVRGESMEPALPDGCSIMFDRSRQDRREHGIYVVRTNGGLIVKRAVKSGRGWELVSENPAVAPEPWPAEAEVVGEVVWVAQTLVGPRRR